MHSREVLTIRPDDEDPVNIYKLMTGLVVPRPIAFISTISSDGVPNLAPFSFYNAVCSRPPVVMFAASVRSRRSADLGAHKDTLANIRATGEFVVNVVSEEITPHMNATAAEVPSDVDEFQLAGLTPLASEAVKPPRVAEAKAQMECRLRDLLVISEEPQGATLVLGTVVRFHVEAGLVERFKVDATKLRAVGRMSGNAYVFTGATFELERPT